MSTPTLTRTERRLMACHERARVISPCRIEALSSFGDAAHVLLERGILLRLPSGLVTVRGRSPRAPALGEP